MEVHPPEHPIHTWRDFFVHIATIVVGLLIAIGLEQTVEYAHHRRELREAREALQREEEANRSAFLFNVQGLRNNIAALQNDLIVLVYLKEHPGTPREKLPGVLTLSNFYTPFTDIAWKSAQTANVTQLMPQDEVFQYAAEYQFLNSINTVSDASWESVSHAQRFNFRDPDPTHLSAADLDDEIHMVEDAMVRKYTLGVELANFMRSFPRFHADWDVRELMHMSIVAPLSPEARSALADAQHLTDQRLAAAPAPKY